MTEIDALKINPKQKPWKLTARKSFIKAKPSIVQRDQVKLSEPIVETTYRNVREKSKDRKGTRSALEHKRTFVPREYQLNRWVQSVLGSTKSRSQLRERVEQAVEGKKIFLILGHCDVVQKALLKRGWVEKPSSDISWKLISTKPLEDDTYRQKYASAAWAHRALQEVKPNLIWNYSGQLMNWREIDEDQFVNQTRGPKIAFTSKVGIASCLQVSHWFQDSSAVKVNFPRCYNLQDSSDRAVFINDYCLTACIGLLSHLVKTSYESGLSGILADGQEAIEWSWVEFAVAHLQNYIVIRKHADIDRVFSPSISTFRWELFLQQYHNIVLGDGKLSADVRRDWIHDLLVRARETIIEVSPYWPHIHIDGTNNIWICKPGFRCRGVGITILNRLDKILEVDKSAAAKGIDSSWIVQKYIERPLLIHKTKFDIRQWFLVSCWNPLTVWFYRDCYLRFCSKPFDMTDFHERIHLCNTAVQNRYAHLKRSRILELPLDNLWEKSQFLKYLKSIKMETVWSTVINTGMKQGLLGVILPAQEMLLESGKTKIRQNSFELYGADFLISEDFVPWLIEVNATPLLQAHSTKFTKMASQCLDDCMKVVLDWSQDRNADTGNFELIYQQREPLNNFIQLSKRDMSIVGMPVRISSLKSRRSSIEGQTRSDKLSTRRRTLSSKMLKAINPSLLAFKIRKTIGQWFSRSSPEKNSEVADAGEENVKRVELLLDMISTGSPAREYSEDKNKTNDPSSVQNGNSTKWPMQMPNEMSNHVYETRLVEDARNLDGRSPPSPKTLSVNANPESNLPAEHYNETFPVQKISSDLSNESGEIV